MPLLALRAAPGRHRAGDAMDVLDDGDTNLTVRTTRFPTHHTHGTGCTYATATTVPQPAGAGHTPGPLVFAGGPSLACGPSVRGRGRWRTAGARSGVRSMGARLIIGGSGAVQWQGENAKRLHAPHASNTTPPYRST
ncbi:bifunctional hydroxymethylpyrimidine kinase/phosphomethylpyrimidine kinase [Chloroflexus aggregans]|uniref:bifunctional hydroxymethylpyrimidine kinase/phosphomethylpyrimidine kinase n=1 Tax=Chloroflexus aggregans TaxID=152260 RepID=UPI0038B8D7B9